MRAMGVLFLSVLSWPAHAELYKCIDASGRTTYSETKDPKAACVIAGGHVTVVPPYQAPAARPAQPAPSATASRQDALRRQIAEQETELADAKKALKAQEEIRLGDEKNYQRVLDRLQPYQDRVADIEKRLAELRAAQTQ